MCLEMIQFQKWWQLLDVHRMQTAGTRSQRQIEMTATWSFTTANKSKPTERSSKP